MVVDASALIDIIGGAPNAERFATTIMNSEAIIAAPTVLEARMVLTKYLGANTDEVVTRTLDKLGVTVVPFGAAEGAEAARAFDQYGSGRNAAGLASAECVSYAVAKLSGQPLLFSGTRFEATDVVSAMKRQKG